MSQSLAMLLQWQAVCSTSLPTLDKWVGQSSLPSVGCPNRPEFSEFPQSPLRASVMVSNSFQLGDTFGQDMDRGYDFVDARQHLLAEGVHSTLGEHVSLDLNHRCTRQTHRHTPIFHRGHILSQFGYEIPAPWSYACRIVIHVQALAQHLPVAEPTGPLDAELAQVLVHPTAKGFVLGPLESQYRLTQTLGRLHGISFPNEQSL